MAVERRPLLLVQFTREPVPGRVKTRLQPALSAGQACEVHLALTRWMLDRLLALGDADVELSVAGDPGHAAFDEYRMRPGLAITQQGEGDLGARMHAALVRGLAAYDKVLLVGSDCPSIDVGYLAEARDALKAHDVVLGPALDGGYVLIGARAIDSSVFDGIAWGTPQVYAQTVDRLEAGKLGWTALAALPDVDRPEDLPGWFAMGERQPSPSSGD